MSEYTMGVVEMRFAEIIEESFAGSLPDFVAAFTSRKKLSKKEIKELKKIIENNGGAKE